MEPSTNNPNNPEQKEVLEAKETNLVKTDPAVSSQPATPPTAQTASTPDPTPTPSFFAKNKKIVLIVAVFVAVLVVLVGVYFLTKNNKINVANSPVNDNINQLETEKPIVTPITNTNLNSSSEDPCKDQSACFKAGGRWDETFATSGAPCPCTGYVPVPSPIPNSNSTTPADIEQTCKDSGGIYKKLGTGLDNCTCPDDKLVYTPPGSYTNFSDKCFQESDLKLKCSNSGGEWREATAEENAIIIEHTYSYGAKIIGKGDCNDPIAPNIFYNKPNTIYNSLNPEGKSEHSDGLNVERYYCKCEKDECADVSGQCEDTVMLVRRKKIASCKYAGGEWQVQDEKCLCKNGKITGEYGGCIEVHTIAEKPIIYLYPEKKQEISVKLNYQGKFTVTYPQYKDGWKVMAYPDGKLVNLGDNKEYSYLFWEGEGNASYDLSKGFVVEGEKTGEFLQNKLSELGLTPKEYNEFIVYWMPKMLHNKYNLIHFATKEEYDDRAVLDINPKPDSIQRVFMVFKPLDGRMEITPQSLTSFEREGFTVVEWGGTME